MSRNAQRIFNFLNLLVFSLPFCMKMRNDHTSGKNVSESLYRYKKTDRYIFQYVFCFMIEQLSYLIRLLSSCSQALSSSSGSTFFSQLEHPLLAFRAMCHLAVRALSSCSLSTVFSQLMHCLLLVGELC